MIRYTKTRQARPVIPVKKSNLPLFSIQSMMRQTQTETTAPKPAEVRKKKPRKNRQLQIVSYSLATLGAIALAASIYYASSILAFIGLGLLFWGILFAYMRTEEYTKKALLDAVASSQTTTIRNLIEGMGYKGSAIYLPPKYFTNPQIIKAYIPKHSATLIPTPEQVQKQEAETILADPDSMLLTPIGADLAKLFEKTLYVNFAMVDLRYLQQNLPRLLIEELEVLQNFEMETEDNKITIKLTEATSNRQSQNPLTEVLASALACALAKATGLPITIERQEASPDGSETTIEYRILPEEAQTKQ
ncbi:MAG: hypothetical protein ACPLKZ_01160 [Candidatus Bathyarchaeales archaeon]